MTGAGWGTINFDRLVQEDISGEMTFEGRCEHQEKGSHARRECTWLVYKTERHYSVMEAGPRRRGGSCREEGGRSPACVALGGRVRGVDLFLSPSKSHGVEGGRCYAGA